MSEYQVIALLNYIAYINGTYDEIVPLAIETEE